MWLLSNQISAHFKLKRTFRNLSLFSGFGTSKLFIAHAHTKAHIKEPTESVPSSKLIIRCAVWTSNHRKKIKDDKKEFQFSNDLCNLSLSYTTHQTAESRYKKLCTHTPVWDQERVKKNLRKFAYFISSRFAFAFKFRFQTIESSRFHSLYCLFNPFFVQLSV